MLNKEKLPYDLREKISDMFFTRIDTGESGAKVFKVSSDTASYYLGLENFSMQQVLEARIMEE